MSAQRHLPLSARLFYAFLLLVSHHAYSYDFWDASLNNVTLPNHFQIDKTINEIIIAANNSICHLSLDLNELNDVLSISPASNDVDTCLFYANKEECQNYHHILVLPETTGTTGTITGQSDGLEYNINETILVCGSNAADPTCYYRQRSNLGEIASFPGEKFCPYIRTSGVSSLLTSTGRLVSGTSLDLRLMMYGIVASDIPYGGTPQVGTANNDVWFNKSPYFVSMYEIGDYIYTFFREEAIEKPLPEDRVLYSRVSRICKNDMGARPVNMTELPPGINNLFTTFLKARMSCSAGTGATSDIPYHYNNLQDTFYLESGSYDGTVNEKHLYAVFSSPDNGPLGSVVCVYTFGTHTNDLEKVFHGDYLRRLQFSDFTVDQNFAPFTDCAAGRSVQEAEKYQLMRPTATQSNGNRPLLQMFGYTFRRVVVDSVQALGGATYEVMFIVAQREEGPDVTLLKATYVLSRPDEDKYHISQQVDLEPRTARTESGSPPTVTQMRLYRSGGNAFVYVGTTEGIYRVSTSRCEQYTDCCSCIAARDPYCAFGQSCVAVSDDNRMSADLVQDVIAGDTSLCARLPGSPSSSPADSPSTAGTTEGGEQATCGGTTGATDSTQATDGTGTVRTPTPTPTQSSGLTPTPPSVGGLPTQKSSDSGHTWTIVGAVAGFVGGMVIGIIAMAMCRYRSNFWWNKFLPQPSHSAAEKGAMDGRGHKSSGASNYTKDDYKKKNNLEHAVQNYSATPGSPAKLNLSTSNQISTFSESPSHAPRPIPVPRSSSLLNASQSSLSSNPPPAYNPKGVATSPYRSAASPSHRPDPNPNLKSISRTPEHLPNHTREVYGHNIVARTPSIDASRKTPRSPPRSIPVSFHAHMSSDPHVEIHDAMTGCSSC